MERLDKIVATAAGISRADARRCILRGKATVNGKILRDIAFKVDVKTDEISLDGKSLTYKKYIYLIMNKPAGVLSATSDKNKKTVIDLLSEELFRKDLFPVGRLDKDTTGLLLITDDGDFAHRLLSPKYKVPKTYIAVLDGDVTDRVVKGFEKGVTLADGTSLSPAKLNVLENKKEAEVTIIEGKYHQIKRMFGVFDLGVNKLTRVSFGGLNLPPDLGVGEARELTETELELIKHQILI